MMRSIQLLVACMALLVGTAGHGRAGVIVGGTGLLTQSNADQLEAWLGEGAITITNIYTKAPGHTAADFHAAVDGEGRTFSVIEVLSGYNQVIGGYNPQSWESVGGYRNTPSLIDRTAFIFNLTSLVKYDQNLNRDGTYQTVNSGHYGPTFGGGHDIHVRTSLNDGTARNYSYGESYPNTIISGTSLQAYFLVGRIEVYTISNDISTVPEPSSLAIFGIGACVMGLGVARRRRGEQQQAAIA